MTSVNAVAESYQAEGRGTKIESPRPRAPPISASHGQVYMSGPLFLSSKGIGWTSWKKRWFILNETSLVFYRSDPNSAPQRGHEFNLTLGGIDLNSSASVVVKEDKKLLTMAFPDGRDGRTFTLKAETLEDLYKWKIALEDALQRAPKFSLVTGQNGSWRNVHSNLDDASFEQLKDRQTGKSSVIGQPVLLALEDMNGTPSFLEKALRFVEKHGVSAEGILRQAADVELVERRIWEYERDSSKSEFSPDEDPHVIADCIKYILRELPSSPVPASCCKALVEAHRTESSMKVIAMRSAISETFPEPNRRLLQRILAMMQSVVSNMAVNRMGISAVAACMAPLLLRPLLAGECDIDNGMDMRGDSAAQLLQAAAAANNAQAIVITLLDEYDNIFGDGADIHGPYTDSEESESESEEITDDDDDDDDYDDDDNDDSFVDNGDGHLSNAEAESQKLYHSETDLQTGISKQAAVKSLMQDILEKRKHHLDASRLDLEKEVERLQEQLRKEMELTVALEAGLRNSQSPLSIALLIDEKMKAELEEIAQSEANVMYLKKKVYDLESHLQQQREQNSRVELDIGKEASSSSLIVALPQIQQTKATQQKAIEDVVRAFTMASGTNKFPTSASRRPSPKGEGTSTSSALSRLTNRLNFLKERRTQIANELQTLNRGRNMNRPYEHRKQGSKSEHHPQSPDNSIRHQEPKGASWEKGHEPETPDSASPTIVEGGKKSGRPPFLQKGISDSFAFVDKGFSKLSPRTFSR